MLARAFADDPLPTLLAPDPTHRPAASRWIFSAFARYGLAFGEAWTVGEFDGVAIWWAPEYVHSNEERAARVGLANGPDVLGQEAWERFSTFGTLTEELHRQSMNEPHWYLNVIGVAPERQGAGLGTTLLDSMFERLDRERLPAYLDTGTDQNVAYYRKRGFVVTAEIREPTTGVLIRGMRHDPR
jgi:ribosomal protein S18 acetylase RimI-like enzyme